LHEEFGEPAADIFGAAMLRASPDLGQIVVKIMSWMLHGQFHVSKNTIGASTGKDENDASEKSVA
jgi:hypothetical protein